jgi:outer membrane protein TolC
MIARFPLWSRLAAAALVSGPLAATEITLGDAIARTLRDHPGVKIERENTARAAGILQSASGQFDPVMLGGYSTSQTRTPAPPYNGPLGLLREDSASGYVALAQPFRNGVVVTPRVSVLDFGNNTTARTRAASSELGVEITVPLLRGRGSASAGANEAAARAGLEAARQAAEFAIESRVFATVNAYWASLAARQTLEVLRETVERGRAVAELVQRFTASGLSDRAAVEQATAQLQEHERRLREGESAYFQARQAFGLALGLAPQELGSIPEPAGELPGGNLTQPPAPRDGQFVAAALQGRRDYLALQRLAEQAAILARRAQLDLRPQLDFGARVGHSGGAADRHRTDRLLGSLSENTTGWNSALSLSVAWPVVNNVARGVLAQQRAAQRTAELNTELAARSIASGVLTTLETLRSAARQHELATRAARAFRFAADREIERARLGEGALNDVIDAELRQTSARLEEIEARRAYFTALAQLRLVTGTLTAAEDDALRLDSRSLLQLPP